MKKAKAKSVKLTAEELKHRNKFFDYVQKNYNSRANKLLYDLQLFYNEVSSMLQEYEEEAEAKNYNSYMFDNFINNYLNRLYIDFSAADEKYYKEELDEAITWLKAVKSERLDD